MNDDLFATKPWMLELAGLIPVRIDDALEKGVVEFRDSDGRVLVNIINIGEDDDE